VGPINISRIVQGEELHGNYRLRQEPMKLTVKVVPVLDAPGTADWENEGGACAPPPYEQEISWRDRDVVRTRGGRHQRSAKMVVPRESITIIRPKELVKDYREAIAQVEGKTVEDVEVDELQAKIRELQAELRVQQKKESEEELAVKRLQEKFNIVRRTL
jgi:hypothetical protein